MGQNVRIRGDFEEKIVVAVGAVVLDKEGRVLLVKHVEEKRGGFWFGKWICPGGRLETGETLTAGVQREIREETSLEVETSGKAVVFDRIVKNGSKTRLHVIYVDFVAKVVGGELKASSDVGVARWFSMEELRERWGELHEDTQKLIRESGILDRDVALVV